MNYLNNEECDYDSVSSVQRYFNVGYTVACRIQEEFKKTKSSMLTVKEIEKMIHQWGVVLPGFAEKLHAAMKKKPNER